MYPQRVLVAFLLLGCAEKPRAADSDAAHTGAGRPEDRPPSAADSGEGGPGDGGPGDGGADSDPAELDDARIVAIDFPKTLACGETATAAVTVENTGTTTWSWEGLYKLGAVDDSDPFYTSDTRVWLEEGEEVPPGSTRTFQIPLTAPDTPAPYTTDWQMVREYVHWFGELTAPLVSVSCSSDGDAEEPPPLDLSAVTWLHTDVSGWEVSATLSSVTFSGDQICLDYDKADEWPIYSDPDGDVVGNPWVFIWWEERWYGATFEWLRPGQICKASYSVAGDHIKQAPFDADSGWTPTSGQTYYFMVSGLARGSERNIEARTAPVAVTWP